MLVKMATRKGHRDDVAQLHFVGNCPAGWFWRTSDEGLRARTGTFGDKVLTTYFSDSKQPYTHGREFLLTTGRGGVFIFI